MKNYHSELLGATVFPETKIIAFYGGIFSQWATCEFECELLPDITLNCAEQGMMLMKAKTFNDQESFDKILNSSSPSTQKSLGRKVKGFDPKVWNEVALDYVSQINYDKFTQNFTWREALKLTDQYELVEASPTDKIWGVGLSEYDPNISDKSKWNGTNWLGIAIMNARTRIIDES